MSDLRHLLGVGGVLLLVSGCGEESLKRAPETLFEPGGITGRICDKATGQWVGGASVALDAPTAPSTETDPDGRFTLSGLPPGEYTVTIDSEGFHSVRHVIVRAGEVTDLGGETCEIEQGELRGRACNEALEAWVGGAEVSVEVPGDDLVTTSDEFGRFLFPEVPVGPRQVTVSAAGFTETYSVEVVAYRSVFAGDVHCGPLGGVHGRICGAQGYWLSGARIVVTLEDGTVVETTTDANGYFTLVDVPAGEQTIQVTKGSFATSFPVVVIGNDTLYLAEPVCIPPTTRIAVVTGVYDSVEEILTGLGFGIRATYEDSPTPSIVDPDGNIDIIEGYGSFWLEDFLGDALWLNGYQIVFFNCGLDDYDLDSPGSAADAAMANLRAFVNDGGSVYASDWANSVVTRAFPGRINFFDDDGDLSAAKVGMEENGVTAEVVDAAMETALGQTTVSLNFNLPAWVVLDQVSAQAGLRIMAVADVTVVDPYTYDESPHTDAPLLVQFNHGLGRVLYTSFHNESQTTSDMQAILNFVVFEL